jgi:hypothetical protein
MQASMTPTIGGYDRGPDAEWGLTNLGGIYDTPPVVGGEGVTPGYNPGLDASIINESIQSQAPGMLAPTPVNPLQAFAEPAFTQPLAALNRQATVDYDKGPGSFQEMDIGAMLAAMGPQAYSPPEQLQARQAPQMQAPVPQAPQAPQIQAPQAPQRQAPAPFVAVIDARRAAEAAARQKQQQDAAAAQQQQQDAAAKAEADRIAAADKAAEASYQDRMRAAARAAGRQGDQGSDEYDIYSEGGVPMSNENLTWFGAAPVSTSPSMNVDYSAALDAISKLGLSDDLSREIQRNYEAYRDSYGQPTATNPTIGSPSWGWMEPFAQAFGIDPAHFDRVEMIDKLHSLGLLDTPSNFTDDMYSAALKSYDLTSSGIHPSLVGLLGLQGLFTANVPSTVGHMAGLVDEIDVMKAIDDAITKNVLGITIPDAGGDRDRDRAEVSIDPDQGSGPF